MNKLKQLWLSFEGRRTYIIATVGTVLNVVVVLYPTLLTQSQLLKIDAVLVALGGAALRSAINGV